MKQEFVTYSGHHHRGWNYAEDHIYISVKLWNSVNGGIRNYNCIISFKKIVKTLIIENEI